MSVGKTRCIYRNAIHQRGVFPTTAVAGADPFADLSSAQRGDSPP